MNSLPEQAVDTGLQQEMMLKLITKGFYRELMNYRITKKGVVSVSSFLLDNLLNDLKNPSSSNGDEYYNHQFAIGNVRNERHQSGRLALQEVSITAQRPDSYEQVAAWLSDPAVRDSFVPAFPKTAQELERYFAQPDREYFTILYNDEPAGMIGADSIDAGSRKLEMKKLIGNKALQGRGIGKTATFLFLYQAFIVMNYDKVFIHSGDTNIRNIILNSKFGFELEGIFFSDVVVEGRKRDVVRMGLLRSHWMDIFKGN
jgi:RimJ/RimL family protein N-acetyltransferase